MYFFYYVYYYFLYFLLEATFFLVKNSLMRLLWKAGNQVLGFKTRGVAIVHISSIISISLNQVLTAGSCSPFTHQIPCVSCT
jgi:hypothetical protein